MRIELGPRDIARVALAPAADPLWELACSVRLLASGDGFAWWRPRLPAGTRVLEWLYADPVPEFLLPRGTDLGAGLAAVLGTEAHRLRAGLRDREVPAALPPWAAALAAGDLRGLPKLVRAMREYFEAAVEPHWDTVLAHVGADRQLRTHVLADEGVGALLSGLGPALRWSAPVLSAEPAGEPIVPAGAGILLTPTFFTLRPHAVRTAGPVRLGYPALHRPARRPAGHEDRQQHGGDQGHPERVGV